VKAFNPLFIHLLGFADLLLHLPYLNRCGTKWPYLCWYAVKKLLIHSLHRWRLCSEWLL